MVQVDQTNSSIILVGMPGAGKSTLGVMLAKALAKDFVDTDLLIQLNAGRSLQSIVEGQGYLALRELEEQALLKYAFSSHIVATGGSAVYSEKGMQRIKSFGQVIYLNVSLDELRHRIHNYDERGIAKKANQSFGDLFDERKML